MYELSEETSTSDAKEEAVSRHNEEIRCREHIRLSGAATGSVEATLVEAWQDAGSAPRGSGFQRVERSAMIRSVPYC
ncbi:hypothetical protein GN244_ATG04160 [Phytophthora infestans]|uniref:Uncharacterized protein n=1 Tax=Phytophthora infestans TaxID=4787 RepID=A0A833W5W5_PHYIN|nr:hypothetical protein GN244_ATG04160 [Phytophthora infestans]